MSSTRHAPAGAPFRQGRYMSAPEFDELLPINGVATAARVALLDDPQDKELIWWLQAQSLQQGGIKHLVQHLLDAYADRIGSTLMHREFKRLESFTGEQLDRVLAQIDPFEAQSQRLAQQALSALRIRKLRGDEGIGDEPKTDRPQETRTRSELAKQCREIALEQLGNFLTRLCIDPALDISEASVFYFDEIISTLRDCKHSGEEAARKDFVLTEIGRQVWDTLDHALARNGMVLIEGLEGRGKSEATKAWCRINAGRARFVSLKGITGKTNVFRALAKALGIASGYGYKANQLQNRVEDVLFRSRLMLVFDEAHFFFDLKPRMYARPELVDWAVTALSNEGVPCALVTTPQFLQSAQQAGEQVNWNWRQFRRRVKQFTALPDANTEADLNAVARKMLPGAGAAGIKLAVAYARLRKLDISGLADVAEEAQLIARGEGRAEIQFEDVNRAIKETLMPTDAAFAQRLTAQKGRRQIAPRAAVPPPLPNTSDTFSDEEGEAFPQRQGLLSTDRLTVSRSASLETPIHG